MKAFILMILKAAYWQSFFIFIHSYMQTMKHFYRFFSRVLFLSGMVNINAQTFVDSITHQSYTRYFRVHLPSGYNPAISYPLVFNFHGYTSNALQQELYTGMSALADEQNFIVVYPEGIGNAWNVGFIPQPYFSGVDDVGFINALLDTLIARYTIDEGKVYACGMSNGGYMSYRLACELSDRITAIASVTGLMTDSTAFYCNPLRAVPVLQIHGTADPVVNYNGFPSSLGVVETLNLWATKNNCGSETSTVNIPNTNTTDLCTVDRIDYTGCTSCGLIRFFKVNGGGHTWPGAAIDLPTNGPTNRDINATREIWNFFQMHSLPCFASLYEEATTGIKIFPNPGTNFIQVDTEHPVQQITLVDMVGRPLIESPNNILNVEAIHSGMYMLIIKTMQHTSAVRWIKSH
jgi:polyhydroxybutyrate depolymerase